MSKFLDFGMTLDQAIARATVNASRVFEVFRDRGTLNVGAPADVAVLELREGAFEFVDNYGNTDRPPAALPGRDRARRQADSASLITRNRREPLMAINSGKVITGGLVAGLVMNVLDMTWNFTVLAADMKVMVDRLRLDPAVMTDV